jgi:hypothetical protein
MTHLDLTDEQETALVALLTRTIAGDHYPLSPRIQVLKGILANLRPEPARPASAPPLKNFAPPSKGRYKRRG